MAKHKQMKYTPTDLDPKTAIFLLFNDILIDFSILQGIQFQEKRWM